MKHSFSGLIRKKEYSQLKYLHTQKTEVLCLQMVWDNLVVHRAKHEIGFLLCSVFEISLDRLRPKCEEQI